MEVDTWAFDSLRNFQDFTRIPVILSSILLDLVAAPVVNEAYFVTTNLENVRLLVKDHQSLDLSKGATHR